MLSERWMLSMDGVPWAIHGPSPSSRREDDVSQVFKHHASHHHEQPYQHYQHQHERHQHQYQQYPRISHGCMIQRGYRMNRFNSAVDMRQLTTALMEAREGTGDVRAALLSASFRPRLPGLTKIVSKLAKEGSWRKALEVYEAVEELGLQPDTALTNSAISACDKGARWQKALEIFDRMESLQLPRDAITYSATISALAKGKQWHAALQVFDHMQDAGVEADVVTCCSLINALERGGQWQLAEKLFLQMCTVQNNDSVYRDDQNFLFSEKSYSSYGAPEFFVASQPTPTTWNEQINNLKRTLTSPHSAMGPVNANYGTSQSKSPFVTASSLTFTERSALESLITTMGAGNPTQDAYNPDIESKLDSIPSAMGINYANSKSEEPEVSKDAHTTVVLNVGENSSPASKDDNASSDHILDSDSISVKTVTPDAVPGLSTDTEVSSEMRKSEGMKEISTSIAATASISLSPTDSGLGDSSVTGLNSPMEPPGMEYLSAGLSMNFDSRLSFGVAHSSKTTNQYDRFLLNSKDMGGLGVQYHPGTNHSMIGLHASSLAPPSRLQRNTSLNKGNDPEQVAAAAHLRRAMSCFPDVDSSEACSVGSGLASMFNFSHASKVTPNRVCCNALLAAYARAKPPQWQKALHLLEAMWSGGPTLIPDAVSYNTVMKACSNAFQVGRAVQIYKDMVSHGVSPNATTFNCLIGAATESDSVSTMHSIGSWLDSSSTDIRAQCMNTYITGLVKLKMWNEALIRFHSMLSPSSPSHPTLATFNAIMNGEIERGDYHAVLRTFDDMRASAVAPTIVAYNNLLTAQASLGAWSEALETLHVILSASRDGINANLTTFNTTLLALSKGSSGSSSQECRDFIAAKAIQLYQHMARTGGPLNPDEVTYSNLIAILASAGYESQILAVHNIMDNAKLVPDSESGHRIIQAAMNAGQIKKGAQVAAALLKNNEKVDPSIIASLLGSCVGNKEWNAARDLCGATLLSQGTEAGTAMYNYVLQCAFQTHKYELAAEIIAQMSSSGLQVDQSISKRVIAHGQMLVGPETSNLLKGTHTSLRHQNSKGKLGADSAAVNIEEMICKLMLDQQESAQPHTPILDSSPGAQLSPENDLTPKDNDNSGLEGTDLAPKSDIDETYKPSSTTKTMQEQHSKEVISVADINDMLSSLSFEKNTRTCVEVLKHMKVAGIKPDGDSYRHVMHALVMDKNYVLASEMCREAHEVGVLNYYRIPNCQKGSSDWSGCTDLDLTGCKHVEEATIVLLTWLQILQTSFKREIISIENDVSIMMLAKTEAKAELNEAFVCDTNSEQSGISGRAVSAELEERVLTEIYEEVIGLLSHEKPLDANDGQYMPVKIEKEDICCDRDNNGAKFTVKFPAKVLLSNWRK